MSAPVDAARTTSQRTTAAAGTAAMPAISGSAAGDLIIWYMRTPGGATMAPSTGWTPLVDDTSPDAADDLNSIYYRVLDGGANDTLTVTFGASTKYAALGWRITGGGTPVLVTAATGSSTTADPPVTPSLTGDYLFLALCGQEGENGVTGDPAGYANPFGTDSGTGGAVATNCGIEGASLQRTGMVAATENPGTFTWSGSDDWTAWTIYIPEGVVVLVPRHSGIDHMNPGLLMKARDAWERRRGILVPRLWTPKGATI